MFSDNSNALTLVPVICLIATLVAATLSDLVAHRIPNLLTGPALLIAIVIGTATSGFDGLILSLAGLAVGLAMLLPMYAIGAMGAGDVKLLGVAGAFLGPFGALVAGLATFVAGALLGLMYIGWRSLRQGVGTDGTSASLFSTGPLSILTGATLWLAQVIGSTKHTGAVASREASRRNSTFAYAPAIFAGSVFSIWQQQNLPVSFLLG
ncbi:MAG: A24 family peptidase [Gammaproteobacteria bacterium]|nr:A24 family peptidase [Gammaproteobacteria bacterium]